jgi:TPR repeat protein
VGDLLHGILARRAPLALLIATGACASPVQRGCEAYDSGDAEAASACWQPCAEAGDARAQFLVGLLHDEGALGAADPAAAAEWYRRSAEQGFAPAQNNLGLLHHRDAMVAASAQEAARWFTLAAEQGFAPAQANLAVLHLLGRAVPQDDTRARELLRLSAAGGNDKAALLLARFYGEGSGSGWPDEAALARAE